jgi:hypothetical protein
MYRCLTSWRAHRREQSAIARGARSVTDAREQQAAQALRDRRRMLREERLGRRQPGSTAERLLQAHTALAAAEAEAVDVLAPAALAGRYEARRLRVDVRAATASEQTQSHSRSEAVVPAQPAPSVGRLVDNGASPVVVHPVQLATRPHAAQVDASREVASAPPHDAVHSVTGQPSQTVNFCGNCGAGGASGKRFCTGCGAPLGSE